MMIRCPKCGFSQPKDKYCAQCGLDIELYRPPKVPFLKRVLSDSFFHLFMILVIALGAGYYVYKSNRSEIQERVSFFKHGVQYARESESAAPPTAPTQAANAVPDNSELPPQMLSGQEGQTSTTSAPTAATANPAPSPVPSPTTTTSPEAAAVKPAADNKSQVQVQYVEVTSPVLEQIYADARNSGLFNSLGDHVAGIWPQGRKKIANLRGWKSMLREAKAIEIGRPLHFFVGLRGNEPESDLGLTTYVEVASVDAAGLRGHLEVVRTWREPSPDGTSTIQRRFYPAQIELPNESLFFLAGVLPRGSAMENDPYLTNIDPFKILKTNFFKNRETEFLIVLEFDRQIQ